MTIHYHSLKKPKLLPSGELTFCHGKSPFFMGKSTMSMAIFNSFLYVHQRVQPFTMFGGFHHYTPHRHLRQRRHTGTATAPKTGPGLPLDGKHGFCRGVDESWKRLDLGSKALGCLGCLGCSVKASSWTSWWKYVGIKLNILVKLDVGCLAHTNWLVMAVSAMCWGKILIACCVKPPHFWREESPQMITEINAGSYSPKVRFRYRSRSVKTVPWPFFYMGMFKHIHIILHLCGHVYKKGRAMINKQDIVGYCEVHYFQTNPHLEVGLPTIVTAIDIWWYMMIYDDIWWYMIYIYIV